MPDSVLMPAPVKTTARRALAINSAKLGDIGIVRHGAIVAKQRPRAKCDVRYCVRE